VAADVVKIGGESLLDFVRREGPVTTQAVAWRFGWDQKKARKELGALLKEGQVARKVEKWSTLGGGGRTAGWRAADQ
jgi:hypothetical protein